MKQALLTTLRNRKTSRPQFRIATEQIGMILATEASEYVPMHSVAIQTPLTDTTGSSIQGGIVIIPILRAGLALLPPFMEMYPYAKVGFIGIKRNEENAEPHLYYQNIPIINETDTVIVIDPMIATGGSGEMAIQMLKQTGASYERLIYVGIVATKEGISKIHALSSSIKIVVAQVDPILNEMKYIVPGLGDFGDRFFGTEGEYV